MISGGSVLKWYWFLNLEVFLAILLGLDIVTVLIFPLNSVLLVLEGYVVLICVCKARSYQQRIYENTGPEVRPPKWFVLFWWIVVALEAMWLAVRMIERMK